MADIITADLHLGHENIIKYCKRPFATIEEHDDTIIDRMNHIARPSDRLIIIGDVCMGDPAKYFARIRCRNIMVIMGGHDYRRLSQFKAIKKIVIHDLKLYYINGQQPAVLCHYPILSWHAMRYNTWHLHGHVHGHLPWPLTKPLRNSLDVGIDVHGFLPWTEDEIRAELVQRQDSSTEGDQEALGIDYT